MLDPEYDCIIVGGGHAGCEAAAALPKLGLSVLLISGNLDRLGYLSCNPAIGGLAKGHLVREIDALGGQMARWADAAAIQYRTLNMSKGPAVRATRAQMDRPAYQAAVKKTLYSIRNLHFWQDNATALLTENGHISGVVTAQGRSFRAKHILLSTGTFLDGRIHIGDVHLPAGRMGDSPALGLSDSLRSFGIKLGRLKTGTTPRILAATVDFTHLEEQEPEEKPLGFSFFGPGPILPQRSCHITWTNETAHKIIRSAFDRSPLFTGIIKGVGARYCPSIEDKVARFPNRERHQIFLEPEGLDSGEIYCNGISTSLPLDIQQRMINAIAGLENAIMVRPGYAIEYDYANPTQLWPTLESKLMPGLWCAGQINGTSGYEEAAAQGLWAAINIAQKLKNEPAFCLGRHEAYMGVLIDDLVTLGTNEPYRMFTSRAEHRLLLREDNAEARLATKGRAIGLVDDAHWGKVCEQQNAAICLKQDLDEIKAEQDGGRRTLSEILRKPEINISELSFLPMNGPDKDKLEYDLSVCHILTRRMVESDIKYAGYLERQKELAARSLKLASVALPADLIYADVAGLSSECVEKLTAVRPANLGQAGRISGLTPAAIACLEIHLHKLGLLRKAPRRMTGTITR